MDGRIRRALHGGLVLLLAAGSIFTATTAAAHAQLVGSDPEDGAVLAEAPAQVELEFTEPIQPDFAQVAVLDADDVHHEAGDPEVTGNRVFQRLDELAPGDYRVSFRVGSTDGHPVSGMITFTVGGAAEEQSPPGEAEQPAPADSADAATTGWTPALVAGATAAAAAAVGALLLVQRRRQDAGASGGHRTDEGP